MGLHVSQDEYVDKEVTLKVGSRRQDLWSMREDIMFTLPKGR